MVSIILYILYLYCIVVLFVCFVLCFCFVVSFSKYQTSSFMPFFPSVLSSNYSTKVSLLGSLEDVQQCNEDRIGFTEECSMCWTHDEICARNNCLFIFIHSVFTNQVNNFNVGPGDITSATCDEAMCGPAFIPCSGATRRRMNIVSDIPRPVSQQCNVASEDWSVVFDHP